MGNCNHCKSGPNIGLPRADSRFVPSQWEMALLCNDVSHWLGTNLESALTAILVMSWIWHIILPSAISTSPVYIHGLHPIITVPADVLAPHSARPSAGTMMTVKHILNKISLAGGDVELPFWRSSKWLRRSGEICGHFSVNSGISHKYAIRIMWYTR